MFMALCLALSICIILLALRGLPNVSFPYRGYNGKKLSDNVQCEIFQTILEEAKDSYSDLIVHELHSNMPEDLERNIDIICQFVLEWSPQA